MRDAIFFAVARNAKIEIRVGQLRCAADRAVVQRLICAARMVFKTFPPCRNLMAMSRLVNNLRAKKDEIVGESSDQRSAIRIRVQHKSTHQKRGENPGKPLDFDWQNKKDVDDLVGIKTRECEEQGRDEHAI